MLRDRCDLALGLRLLVPILCSMSSLWAACSGEQSTLEPTPQESEANTSPVRDDGVVLVDTTECSADNPFCRDTGDTETAAPGCGSVPLDLRSAGVNIMLAIDGSRSMEKHWEKVLNTVRSVRVNNPDAAIGAHVFWSDAVDPDSERIEEVRNDSNNACIDIQQDVLEVGAHSEDDLVTFIGDGPRGGIIYDVYQVAPIVNSINEYLTGTIPLADPEKTNYLLVFTHGNDNCFGSAYTRTEERMLAYQKLAIDLYRKNIRVIPVGLDAPMMETEADPLQALFDPGFIGTNPMDTVTDYKVMQTLLDHGGSGLMEVPRIDTEEELTKLVSLVSRSFSSCRFALSGAVGGSTEINPFQVNFTIGGVEVPRDRFRENGWDFIGGSDGQVEFFGQGCEALQSGRELDATFACEQSVCGSSAVELKSAPRMVLLVLDASASRTECADGTLDCALLPYSDPNRPPSFWEVVQNAVSDVLVAPVNEDVLFGMQFFPGKTEADFSCEVADEPEIKPGPGQQIQIMQATLEKRPNGLSPVVAVIESVAANPGELASPDVIGSVVFLTDGGDNCSGDEQEQIVARLGEAAKTLAEQGIRTFAVRYGSEAAQTDFQAEQLAAVAENGGTADPDAGVSYIDAKSPEEFKAALESISGQLATCTFSFAYQGPEQDKDRTNLYIDGAPIGFDSTGSRENGWAWVDSARTSIELFGDACETFKSKHHSNISLEFGCTPEVLF